MQELRDVLSELIQPLAEKFAKDLADLLANKIETQVRQLVDSFDVALSSFAADLEAGETASQAEAVEPARPAKTKAPRAPKETAAAEPGKRRNHCKTCGLAGYQTKTHGYTHDANGPIERPRTPRKAKAAEASEESDDDDEPAAAPPPARRAPVVDPAPVPEPVRVVAAEPPAAQDPPPGRTLPPDHPNRDLRTITRKEAAELERTQPVVNVRVPGMQWGAPPAPRPKTVNRGKALKEIRIAQLRRAAEMRAAAEREEEVAKAKISRTPDDEDREPVPSRSSEDDVDLDDVAPLTEREVLKDFRAADLD